jgi:hypothetical protein
MNALHVRTGEALGKKCREFGFPPFFFPPDLQRSYAHIFLERQLALTVPEREEISIAPCDRPTSRFTR